MRRVPFSATRVSQVIRALSTDGANPEEVRNRWLEAVAVRAVTARPDLASGILGVLEVAPVGEDYLRGMSIGEVGVCYEALLALISGRARRSAGQYFTPDDAAHFMAQKAIGFGDGVWLDPCCGVGNLAWHLASVQDRPGLFVRRSLILVDADKTALRTAIALLSVGWADQGDSDAVAALNARAECRDFLSESPVPRHDYVIANPPYARADLHPDFETSRSRELFALFLERIAKDSKGFIAVTPASYLSIPKFQTLRNVLDQEFDGGDVFVFDNVPDTFFRGYKFGSNNTSKTNFVRAAVTVCAPDQIGWRTTPILRWAATHRSVMFEECERLLTPRRIGPHGEWTKIGPGMDRLWRELGAVPRTVGDLVVPEETRWSLDVAMTPRYYVSAARRTLRRGSKTTLYFASEADRDHVAVVLNSSIPYFWWRVLDGGVTLPRRVLLSTPVPEVEVPPEVRESLWDSERDNVVVKVNAGRKNENIKHPATIVRRLNELVLPTEIDLSPLYSNNMFPLASRT